MLRSIVNDLDCVTAGLHGRRSKLAEGERLEGLCGIDSLPKLGLSVYPESEFHAAGDFQRRLAQDLVQEFYRLRSNKDKAGADLVDWFLVRFQIESIKVLLRRFMVPATLESPEEYLLSLPQDLALDTQKLLAASSLDEFARILPRGSPRQRLIQALDIYRENPRPFFLEGALDCGYFQEALSRGRRVPAEDRELICPILLQEVDAFHLMLVVRGKFHYGLAPELLLPLHVRSSGISNERFRAMLAAPDLLAAARMAVGVAMDRPPSTQGPDKPSTEDASRLEGLCRKRFLRLSNRAFRRSHMGLAAVVGYVGIRRVELANLVTLSEGVVAGTAKDTLRARLVPRAEAGPDYV